MITELSSGFEKGQLGIFHAQRFWSAAMLQCQGIMPDRQGEAHLDRVLLDCLGLGLGQTIQYLYARTPTFADFEQWIQDTAGIPETGRVRRFNNEYSRQDPGSAKEHPQSFIESLPAVLEHEDLKFWHENGYIKISDVIDADLLSNAREAIWESVNGSPDNPSTWYGHDRSGIMVELIQHSALEAVRRSPRIHKAFSQLWGTSQLWTSADRCSFHPPQTPTHSFQGPDLHWDVDLNHPVKLFTQGLLYLTDTCAEQGALTLVPGFHHKFTDWYKRSGCLSQVDAAELHAQGSVPVAAKAGGLIIWHHWLPHGSRPNLGKQPRLVQYINCYPMHLDYDKQLLK